MDDKSAFQLISEVIREEGIACVLIGGFAVNYYKVARQTVDLDFLITREDFDRITGRLKEEGYGEVSVRENFAKLRSSRRTLMDLDFMFVDAETVSEIFNEGKQLKIAKQLFTVPSLDHLIALKLHSVRHNPKIRFVRDVPDIVSLMRMNDISVKDKRFKELCSKYGTEEIFRKVSEILE